MFRRLFLSLTSVQTLKVQLQILPNTTTQCDTTIKSVASVEMLWDFLEASSRLGWLGAALVPQPETNPIAYELFLTAPFFCFFVFFFGPCSNTMPPPLETCVGLLVELCLNTDAKRNIAGKRM